MSRILLVILTGLQIGVSAHFGIQSGPETPQSSSFSSGARSWATQMAYNEFDNKLYLTGYTSGDYFGGESNSSGGSQTEQEQAFRCFVSELELPEDDSHATTPLQFTRSASFGTDTSSESCYSMTLVSDSKILLGGNSHSNNGGVLSPLKPPGGSIKPLLFGTILDIDLFATAGGAPPGDSLAPPDGTSNAQFQLKGGRLMRLGGVHYPVSMVTDRSRESIYVATLLSDDTTPNTLFDPNHPQIHQYPYGSQFRVYVEKLVFTKSTDDSTRERSLQQDTSTDLQETLQSVWYLGVGNANQHSVYVGGLVFGSDSLFLCGTTTGNSEVFPDETPIFAEDYDGFCVEIGVSDGKLTNKKLRLSTQEGEDDQILATCQQEGEENEMYVVGSTTGTFSDNNDNDGLTKAFLAKIRLDSSLDIVWTKELGAVSGPLSSNGESPSLVGVACAVTEDGDAVYMAARALEGSVVDRPGHKSYGGTDIVVVQHRGENGSINYVRQIGTGGDDIVTSISTDEDNNALVYGSTGGSLMRLKSPQEASKMDVFLFSMSSDTGDFGVPAEQKGSGGGGGSATDPPAGTDPPVTTDPPVITDPPGNPDDGGPVIDDTDLETIPPNIDVVPPPDNTNAENNPNDGSNDNKNNTGLVVFALLAIVGVILVALYTYRRRYAGHSKLYYPADSDHIVEYLKGFDDVEVDLKHSATGGWHGTYMNSPADSRNGLEVNVDRMSNTAAQDSLFMDDYDHPSLGGTQGIVAADPFVIGSMDDDDDANYDEREGLTGGDRRSSQGSNYDGLVDAYNSTWEDRSPSSSRGSDTSGSGLGMPETNNKKKNGEAPTSSLLASSSDEVWGNEII